MKLLWLYGLILFPAIALAETCPIEISSYPVSGESIEQIAKQISLFGPIDDAGTRRDAFLRWDIGWRWDLHNGKPDYRTLKVSCSAKLIKPTHRNPEKLSAADLAEWKRYLNALDQHEYEHYQLIKSNFARVEAVLADAISADPNLHYSKANRAASLALSELRRLDRDLDQRSDHGRLDGVKLVSISR